MNEILWTRRALQDIEDIHRYIAQTNPESARTVISAIRNATQPLSYHLFIGRPGRREGTRELVVLKTPFIVVYKVQENVVQIIRVLHGAQKYPS